MHLRALRDTALASSLTEIFPPKFHENRIELLLKYYDFANADSLSYFRKSLTEAAKDVQFGLAWVLKHADTPEKQDAACEALTFKVNCCGRNLTSCGAPMCSIPDDHIDPRRSALFMARWVLRDVRDGVLLGPEKAVALDVIGDAIVSRVDGKASFAEIIADLAATFSAPEAQIAGEVQRFLVGLRARMFLAVRT
jgi:coenzyme PQQ biosynthesis protein PqqD